jgi:hypothetical protein
MSDVPRPSRDPPNCEKCGRLTVLVAVISRLGNESAQRIFHCEACDTLQWVAEVVSGKDAGT